MNITTFEKIVIPDSKIREYLLNENHSDGGTKATFFILNGFDAESIFLFNQMLLEQLVKNEPILMIDTVFGRKFIIDGYVKSPNDAEFLLRSIWMKPINENVLKFVTAYPIVK